MAEKQCNLIKNGGGTVTLTGLPAYASGIKSGNLCIIYLDNISNADIISGLPKPSHSFIYPLVYGTSMAGYVLYNVSTDTWQKMVGANNGWGNLVYFTEE